LTSSSVADDLDGDQRDSPASVNVNRVEYRIRSLSVAEVSSARAGDTATDATTARASARIGQG
jgi:hypothetical protein